VDLLGETPDLSRWAGEPTEDLIAPMAAAGSVTAAAGTHLHSDDFDVASLQGALAPGAPVLCPVQAADTVAEAGFNARGVEEWEAVEVGDLHVTAVPAVDGFGSPGDIDIIVLSHGHSDHTTGLHGLVKQLGRPNVPVLVHPEFWNRRRVALPSGLIELPSTSRTALEGAGFEIVEEQQPSFLLDGSLLVTGEVDRTSGFEQGSRSTRPIATAAGSPTR
jgi:L-ascorbate metabolism protein UlaG (beta-lactamase superfamily)